MTTKRAIQEVPAELYDILREAGGRPVRTTESHGHGLNEGPVDMTIEHWTTPKGMVLVMLMYDRHGKRELQHWDVYILVSGNAKVTDTLKSLKKFLED